MLIVLEALNGAVAAVLFPALQGMLPQLVPREDLKNANVLQSLARGALRVIGPSISALLVVGVGAGWALAADAVTWLAAGALLLMVQLPPPDGRTGRTSALSELREGWTLFRTTKWLWVVVLAFGFMNAIHTGAWFTVGPAYAKQTIGAQGWGLLLSAESVGLLVMSAIMLRRTFRRPPTAARRDARDRVVRHPDPVVRRRSARRPARGRLLRRRCRNRDLQPGLDAGHAGEHRRADALARLLL
jgi:MFS family permease